MSSLAQTRQFVYVGCGDSFVYRDPSNSWPVVGTGLAGLTFTGTIAGDDGTPVHVLDTSELYRDTVDGSLALVVTVSAAVTNKIGVGRFSIGVRGHDVDAIYPLIEIDLEVRCFPDRDA